MMPMQFGPTMRSPCAPRREPDLIAQGALAIAEAGRCHDGGAHACPSGLLDDAEHALRRHRDDDEIGRFGQLGEGREAGPALDLDMMRIDGIDRPPRTRPR